MKEKIITEISKNDFSDVITIIENARERALLAVTRELINMYWDIGEYVSRRTADSGWGKSTVKEFSDYIQMSFLGIKGFSVSNIWRMKQFYETYCKHEKFAPLLRELPWSHNMLIMPCSTYEEREFYLKLSTKYRYTHRELKRQIDSGLYERTMLSDKANSKYYPLLTTLRCYSIRRSFDTPWKKSLATSLLRFS